MHSHMNIKFSESTSVLHCHYHAPMLHAHSFIIYCILHYVYNLHLSKWFIVTACLWKKTYKGGMGIVWLN